MEAILALEDGKVFKGRSFGATGERVGEVVFNTSMVGYQEVLTDPSYRGQIVIMTYPEIGNYGVNEEDIDWEPLEKIKRNEGPETARRLGSRREMYETHRWVREALAEPAVHAA